MLNTAEVKQGHVGAHCSDTRAIVIMSRIFHCFHVCLFAATFHLCAGNTSATVRDAPETIRGAVYIPFEAFNAPQMWKNFNIDETRRDFGYAAKIHLNALRVWASYEYWQMEPERFKASFDQFLVTADANHIRILISLFEHDGVPPTPENMWSTNPAKSFAIQSPGLEIDGDPARWEKPREFLKWFMENYRNDTRLLAIEIMNEPFAKSAPFAKEMLITANSLRGNVPLTMGLCKTDEVKTYFPPGLDVIEFHDNFPRNPNTFENQIKIALAVGKEHNLPVWLTEWQRARPGGGGWGKEKLASQEEAMPNYATLAVSVRRYPIGNFFWSLMVKRAYLQSQRLKGTVNGLFWPDGSVFSLEDARSIAQDPKLELTEKKSLPAGFLDFLKSK